MFCVTHVDLETVRFAQLVLILEQDELWTLDLDLDCEVVVASGYAGRQKLDAVSGRRWRRNVNGGGGSRSAELIVDEEVDYQQNIVDVDAQTQEANRKINFTKIE